MDMNTLKAFLITAEEKSINKAARRLWVSPATLLSRLNKLEEELGFSLFIRTHQGVMLSPTGEYFIRYVRSSMNQLDLLVEKCREMEKRQAQTIHISIHRPYDFIHYGNEYAALHPDVRFSYCTCHASATSISETMTEYGIDIMQMHYSKTILQEELICLPIRISPIVCMTKKTHPLAKQRCVSEKQLKQHSVSTFGALGEFLREQEMFSPDFPLREINYSDSDLLTCCNEGGVFLMEENLAKIFGELNSVPLEPQIFWLHCIVFKRNASRRIYDFADYVRKSLGDQSERIAEVSARYGMTPYQKQLP